MRSRDLKLNQRIVLKYYPLIYIDMIIATTKQKLILKFNFLLQKQRFCITSNFLLVNYRTNITI